MKHGESGVLQVVDMTGENLLRTLEYAIPADNDIRGWFYYFSGLKMTYAPSAMPGKRIIKITDAEGKPLEAQRVYTAAVMDQTFPEDAIQSLTDTGISIQALLTETIQSRKPSLPAKTGGSSSGSLLHAVQPYPRLRGTCPISKRRMAKGKIPWPFSMLMYTQSLTLPRME